MKKKQPALLKHVLSKEFLSESDLCKPAKNKPRINLSKTSQPPKPSSANYYFSAVAKKINNFFKKLSKITDLEEGEIMDL